MTKEKRMLIYNKFDGHCAYCGTKIDYKNMQVDHIESKFKMEGKSQKEINRVCNLNPACRQCNLYKSVDSLETFRGVIQSLRLRLDKSFIYRLAKKYGIVQEHKWDGKFYFERKTK